MINIRAKGTQPLYVSQFGQNPAQPPILFFLTENNDCKISLIGGDSFNKKI